MKRNNDISQNLKNYVNATVNRAERNIVNFSAESKMSGSVSDGVTKIYPNTNAKTLICESINDNEYRTITLNPCDGSITLKNGTVSGISDVSGEDQTVALSQRALIKLQGDLDQKADKVHTHNISDVNDLQASLDNKADKNHTHTSFNNDININGNIIFPDSGTNTREIKFTAGSNDYGRLAVGATSKDNGWLELATTDNGNEPIYVRQYYNSNIKHEAVLLDANGNTTFPGTVTSPNITTLTQTSNTHTNEIANINSTLNTKVDKTKVTTYFRTATRSQRWGFTTKYGYDILGYIKAVNRIYTNIAGVIKVSVTTTNNLNEVFEVSVSYGCGGSVNSNFKLTGNSSISNGNGKTAIALNPVDESKSAYSIAIVIDGYTNNDSCGYSVVMLMPEMLKLYSNAECTQELSTSNYNTSQGNYGFGTVNKDSLAYSNIYWNEESRALKVHSHVIADVNDLQASLDNKADKNHTHTSFNNDISINGNISFNESGTNTREIKFKVGSDDFARIAVGAPSRDKGWLEIATSDNGDEPIYVRQYKNPRQEFATVAHEVVLLDANGNTTFPGTVTTPNINAPNKADKNHTHTINDITGVVKSVSVQYEYKVSDLTLTNPYNWGQAYNVGTVFQPTWETLNKHTIKITFFQKSQVKPNLRIILDNNDSTVVYTFNYNVVNNFQEMVYGDRSFNIYTDTATIDLSPITFTGNYNTNICKFMFEQDGTTYATGSFYIYKNRSANITKPDTSQLATMQALIDLIYPVGSLYTSFNNINPGYFLGGMWEQIVDRFLYCANNSKQTGGSKKITVENLPPHSHSIITAENATGDPDGAADSAPNRYNYWRGVKSFDTGKTGSGTDYMPPYLSIYAWYRTN